MVKGFAGDTGYDMARVWRIEEAGSRFSEVVPAALSNGPQVVTRNGADTAVVMSFDEFRS